MDNERIATIGSGNLPADVARLMAGDQRPSVIIIDDGNVFDMEKPKNNFEDEPPQIAKPLIKSSGHAEIKKNVTIMAAVMGMSREQIEKEIQNEYEGADLDFAEGTLNETLKLYGDGNKVNRKIIRKNRAKNNISFSQTVRKRLK